jgi:Protein of unknown function (DUF2842)
MLMSNPTRKFVGTVGLLALLIVYSLLIMVFATSSLPAMSGWLKTLFYLVAGIGWVPIAMFIVSWMYKNDTRRPRP